MLAYVLINLSSVSLLAFFRSYGRCRVTIFYSLSINVFRRIKVEVNERL